MNEWRRCLAVAYAASREYICRKFNTFTFGTFSPKSNAFATTVGHTPYSKGTTKLY
jgi:hypothetical protein